MQPAALRYYRYVLRQVRRLPALEQTYYAQYARSQFRGHMDEIDQDRIIQVADSGMQSIGWVLRKYDLEAPHTEWSHGLGTHSDDSQWKPPTR